MAERDLEYMTHMLDTAKQIMLIIRETDQQAYDNDRVTRLALAHLVQIIGEAASKISREYPESHPELPWKAMIGMRNKIVHDYLGLDEDVLWEVAISDIPPLAIELTRVIDKEGL